MGGIYKNGDPDKLSPFNVKRNQYSLNPYNINPKTTQNNADLCHCMSYIHTKQLNGVEGPLICSQSNSIDDLADCKEDSQPTNNDHPPGIADITTRISGSE